MNDNINDYLDEDQVFLINDDDLHIDRTDRIIEAINTLTDIGEYTLAKMLMNRYGDYIEKECFRVDQILNGKL